MTPSSSAAASRKPAGELFPLIYDQLRAVARRRLALERAGGSGHTLPPTAVVHEAFARLERDQAAAWRSSGELFNAAAREIERVLIDHARVKYADKRGGDPAKTGRVRIPLDVLDLADQQAEECTLALHEAICRLEEEDSQAAAVVRLRFFAGLTSPEAAKALGVSERTVVRDWTFARAFLAAELGVGGEADGE